MEGGAALNRVTWTQSGLHVAAGDDLGKIWVYDVGEALAVPHPDEWTKFAHTLQVPGWLGLGRVSYWGSRGILGVIRGENDGKLKLT